MKTNKKVLKIKPLEALPGLAGVSNIYLPVSILAEIKQMSILFIKKE